MRTLTFCLLALSLTCLASCAGKGRGPGSDYATVGNEPRRDGEAARRKNAEALGLMTAGKFHEAELVLKEALAQDVTFGPAHNNLGKAYYHQSEFYLAAWEFQYASKLMPYQPEPRNNLGLVFESAGKLNQAVDSYDEAMAMEPDNPQLIANDARARFRRGDRDEHLHELLDKLVLKGFPAGMVSVGAGEAGPDGGTSGDPTLGASHLLPLRTHV